GIAEEKIVVTPNGVDPAFRPDGARPNGRPYALFVGALQRRKDPVAAVEALALVPDELGLVFVGPDKGGGEEARRAVEEPGLRGRVSFRGYLPQDKLAELYRGAACLVFPSRYEGFGLPVLEAMASGTPVVASTAGPIPEVAGDAAVLIPSRDPLALAEGVVRALAEHDRLHALGLERSR